MRKKQNYQWDELSLGTCYYPEHWDKKLWAEDLNRMLSNGIGTIRIGEFAWSKVEPREGEFTYEFFDDFLRVVSETKMKVIFGTPTATPPAWLTEKYPEVLNCRMDGVKYRHGMRRHYNYNSPVYQKLCCRIVEKTAEHYAGHPNLIGWQIDNEINCETAEFYSESDTLAFRDFLKETYKTLENLNQAWGAVFWNQEYTEWEQVYVPRTTIHDSTNPHQTLDYIRFVSESAIRFCRMQSDILRKHIKPGDFITTNGMFGNLDNHRMTDEALDVYTYDSYPNFAYCLSENPKNPENLNDRRWSEHLTEVRSICPHFGIMEQQSGANGWNTRMEAPAPKPGQMMLWAMQSIAHGADYVSFFRWRTCTFGTEIYWHGILDYDNRDNRKLAEVHKLYDRTRALKEMTGAEYKAAFAVVRDYSNVWDSQVDVWHQRLIWSSEEAIFKASQLSHTPMDYMYLLEETEPEELQKYPVLIYPHGLILSDRKAGLLKAYVENGGTLILGARTGQKDENGRCVMQPMPGLLASAAGGNVQEFTFIGPADDAVHMDWDGSSMDTGIFNDILEASGRETKVLARYSSNYYEGRPALLENPCGKGRILHFGGTFTEDNMKAFLKYTEVISPWEDIIEAPETCEICVREKGGVDYVIVLNYSGKTQKVVIKEPAEDMDTQEKVQGYVLLKPYETKVYKVIAD
ncbi:beta-galactosidase [Novisyntrophococcus fermenticellae]|uniref:beta-galactosidase n=1 Tax=Novisyntrophococcus fermenticellae TaxID=2068655 RepID=UPI001E56B20E|nr:beta-galactosidase [Novisyntrophococcus fermenticellae]